MANEDFSVIIRDIKREEYEKLAKECMDGKYPCFYFLNIKKPYFIIMAKPDKIVYADMTVTEGNITIETDEIYVEIKDGKNLVYDGVGDIDLDLLFEDLNKMIHDLESLYPNHPYVLNARKIFNRVKFKLKVFGLIK